MRFPQSFMSKISTAQPYLGSIETLQPVQDPATGELLVFNSFALLVGMLLDQQVQGIKVPEGDQFYYWISSNPRAGVCRVRLCSQTEERLWAATSGLHIWCFIQRNFR